MRRLFLDVIRFLWVRDTFRGVSVLRHTAGQFGCVSSRTVKQEEACWCARICVWPQDQNSGTVITAIGMLVTGDLRPFTDQYRLRIPLRFLPRTGKLAFLCIALVVMNMRGRKNIAALIMDVFMNLCQRAPQSAVIFITEGIMRVDYKIRVTAVGGAFRDVLMNSKRLRCTDQDQEVLETICV